MADPVSPLSSFGSGIGSIIGSEEAQGDLSAGLSAVNNISSGFAGTTQPYNTFGQSFIGPTTNNINAVQDVAKQGPKDYQSFMKDYSTSPGGQYLIGQANNGQNNSAGAAGKVLSGSNERALATIDTGLANTDANTAYTNYLAGNQQHFGQLETSLGNMFSAIGVGTTATGQQAGVDSSQMNATSQIAQAQAKNDQSMGSGFGSLFSGAAGLLGKAAAF